MKKLEFFDTHCHIQFPEYPLEEEVVLKGAQDAGVNKMLVVGCGIDDSRLGIEFSTRHKNVWAAIGLHPHEAKNYVEDHKKMQQFAELASKDRVVAIGECGLDYHYMNSPKELQKKLLRFQLDMAVKHDLPLVFHVRDAFDDFFEIIDHYKGLRGVVHSFSATKKELERILSYGFLVGLNGIVTFTKDAHQLDAAKSAPLTKIVLETDAPYLTPIPFRGKICEPKHVVTTAEFLAKLRGEELSLVAEQTTTNAIELFGLEK